MNTIKIEDFDRIISKIKCEFLLHRQFFGLILAKINIKLVDEPSNGAGAYTNGKNICFFKDNVEQFTIENLKFILCHEILHLLLDHLVRKKDRNPIIWNFAADYMVNYLLANNKTGKNDKDPIGEQPEGTLYSEIYNDNWNVEQIYNDLIENGKSPDGMLKIVNISTGNIKDNRNKKTDQHSIQINDKYEMSVEEAREFASEICSGLDRLFSKSESSSCISRIMQSLENINYNWKAVLYKYVRNMVIQNNSTWRRPSRRSVAVNTYLPKIDKSKYFKCNIAIDTSGSMNEEDIRDIFSNIYSICKQLNKYTLNIFTFSGVCHKDTLQTITEKNSSYKLQQIQLKSNLSTDISSAFDFVNENKTLQDADVFIVMTDGFDNIDNLEYDSPLIWCISSNPTFKSPKRCAKSIVISIPKR